MVSKLAGYPHLHCSENQNRVVCSAMMVVRLVSGTEGELAYRGEVKLMSEWCRVNNFLKPQKNERACY